MYHHGAVCITEVEVLGILVSFKPRELCVIIIEAYIYTYYGAVCVTEVEFIYYGVSLGQKGLSVILSCLS